MSKKELEKLEKLDDVFSVMQEHIDTLMEHIDKMLEASKENEKIINELIKSRE